MLQEAAKKGAANKMSTKRKRTEVETFVKCLILKESSSDSEDPDQFQYIDSSDDLCNSAEDAESVQSGDFIAAKVEGKTATSSRNYVAQVVKMYDNGCTVTVQF
ncbi:hypothetical protein PR048_019050 [Dryococelus australis]|uniref:Uncharacterized protein n=1 Tax=Dryococelus australis TaxID=614101 RepID=A0ABQ9H2I3_9NEOP|nr:hypothetical protein PR048_019050 [Dryococelus australis]